MSGECSFWGRLENGGGIIHDDIMHVAGFLSEYSEWLGIKKLNKVLSMLADPEWLHEHYDFAEDEIYEISKYVKSLQKKHLEKQK